MACNVKIAVETFVQAPIADAWKAYTSPSDIVKWNAASDDWHTTTASVDLRARGFFLVTNGGQGWQAILDNFKRHVEVG
jgi:uncharacterized protein YndB with AHSA1/START domain